MAKNKKAVTTEHQATELAESTLDKSSLSSLEYLRPAITLLGDILVETNDNYQALVCKSQSLHSAKEAGKSLRELSKQYARVLISALEYPGDFEAELDDELDFEDEDTSDVDLLED